MVVLVLLILSVPLLILLLIFGLSGTEGGLRHQISGIWTNQSDTLQIMIMEDGKGLHGHVVSAQVQKDNKAPVVGKMVMDKMKRMPIREWSIGKYIDPYTTRVCDIKIKPKDGTTLDVCFVEEDHVVKQEEWKLVNTL